MVFNTNPDCLKLIKEGKCKADCCGCIPLNERYWRILKKHVQTDDYKIFKFKSFGENMVKAVTKDFKCVFVKPDYTCAIHNSHLRSEVCKKFGQDATEPLLACPNINEDKKDFLAEYSDKKIKALALKADPAALEYLKRK